jgi:hypothetical protein
MSDPKPPPGFPAGRVPIVGEIVEGGRVILKRPLPKARKPKT